MKLPPSPSIWQHPYVDVLKQHVSMDIQKKEMGDVTQYMDKIIRKPVYKILGNVSAANYVEIPSSSEPQLCDLALTGSYAYLQIKLLPPNTTFHLDIDTTNKLPLRITCSNIYSECTAKGNVLRIPLPAVSSKWVVLGLDLEEICKKHPSCQTRNGSFVSIKGIKLCSSMLLRGIYTSDTIYEFKTLPTKLKLYKSDEDGGANYHWIWIPSKPRSNESATRKKSLAKHSTFDKTKVTRRSNQNANQTVPERIPKHAYSSPSSVNAWGSHTNIGLHGKDRGATNTALGFSTLASVESNRSAMNTSNWENEAAAHQNAMEHSMNKNFSKASISQPLSSIPTPFEDNANPLLQLERVIGYTGKKSTCLLWGNDGRSCVFPSESLIVILRFNASFGDGTKAKFYNAQDMDGLQNCMVSEPINQDDAPTVSREEKPMDTTQKFLLGHTAPVCALAFNSDCSFLASTQTGNNPAIRIWDYHRQVCCAIIVGQSSNISCLSFSLHDYHLAAMGFDTHHRTQIIVWDLTGMCTDSSRCSPIIIARQTCEYQIESMKFSPYEPNRIITCGRENIRFWRIKNRHLPGCPVVLNEYARNTTYSDIAFDKLYGTHPASIPHQKPLFVATSKGTVVQIDYDTMELRCVYKLHDGPINCISVNEGFCVTGSADQFLRVWPLDFSDYFLEAYHEEPVTTLNVSSDGLKLLAGTNGGSIGVLDLTCHSYQTAMRSHTKCIDAMAVDPSRLELATASDDGTVRVWDIASGLQNYEFDIQRDKSSCIVFHPKRRLLAVGFHSGCTRIFDVVSTAVIEEYQQHRDSVTSIAYSADTRHLYSIGKDQQICVYDATNGYKPLKMISTEFCTSTASLQISTNNKYMALMKDSGASILLLNLPMLTLCRTIVTKRKQTASKSASSQFRWLTFSKNSNCIIALLQNNRVLWLSVDSGELLRSTLLVNSSTIQSICLSPNEQYIVTGDENKAIKVWDYENRSDCGTISKPAQTFIGHSGGISALKFVHNGLKIISIGSDASIFIWKFTGSLESGQLEIFDAAASIVSIVPESIDGDSFSETQSPGLDVKSASAQLVENSSTKDITPAQTVNMCAKSILHRRKYAVWHPSSGVIGYVCGSYVLIENLYSDECYKMQQHKFDIVAIALGKSSSLVATADLSAKEVIVWDFSSAKIQSRVDMNSKFQKINHIIFSVEEDTIAVFGLNSLDYTGYVAICSIKNSLVLASQSFECRQDFPTFRLLVGDPSLFEMGFISSDMECKKLSWDGKAIQMQRLGLKNTSGVVVKAMAMSHKRLGQKLHVLVLDSAWNFRLYVCPGSQEEYCLTIVELFNKKVSSMEWVGPNGKQVVLLEGSNLHIITLDSALSICKNRTKAYSYIKIDAGVLISSIAWNESALHGIFTTVEGSVVSVDMQSTDPVCTRMHSAPTSKSVSNVAMSEDAELIAVASKTCHDQDIIQVTESNRGCVVCEFLVENTCCISLSIRKFEQNYTLLLAAYDDGSLRVYNIDKMKVEFQVNPFEHKEGHLIVSQMQFLDHQNVLILNHDGHTLSILRTLPKDVNKVVVDEIVSSQACTWDRLLRVRTSKRDSTLFLLIAQFQGKTKIYVFRDSGIPDCDPIMIGGWESTPAKTMTIDAVFSQKNEPVVIYSSVDHGGQTHIYKKNYNTGRNVYRATLDYFPSSIEYFKFSIAEEEYHIICWHTDRSKSIVFDNVWNKTTLSFDNAPASSLPQLICTDTGLFSMHSSKDCLEIARLTPIDERSVDYTM